ncbi:MAG: hypothetical protein MMC23_008480 [Stictis urceolatum]|nr:hypothetical protein [Stictis urceolata]
MTISSFDSLNGLLPLEPPRLQCTVAQYQDRLDQYLTSSPERGVMTPQEMEATYNEEPMASNYDKIYAHHLDDLDWLLQELDLQLCQKALDLACGSGLILAAAAANVGPTGVVVGVDYAQPMLPLARAKYQSMVTLYGAGISGSIDTRSR